MEPCAERLRRGLQDLHEYVDELCDRMQQVEPDVLALVAEPGRRTRLHAEADMVLRRWPGSAARPPLFGVPVAVKDVVRVDGLPTRAGSRVPADVLAGPQAAMVHRLRDAGVLVAAKSVTAEFANFAPNETRNPWDLGRTPGGSSSGSAAAVATGTAVLGTGTQTVGSVVRPAAFCGVVGWKSTHGRVDIDGVIAHSPSLDAVGMFASDVAGVTAAAGVLCSGWAPGPVGTGVEALTVTVPVGDYLDQAGDQARAVFDRQLGQLEAAGHNVREVGFESLLGPFPDLLEHNLTVNRYELARTHRRWFDQYRDCYREQTATAIEHGRRIGEPAYADARRHLDILRAALPGRLKALGPGLLVTPATLGPAPEGIESTGDPAMALPWTYAGLPAVSLPGAVSDDGLPLGLQLVGPAGADEVLLRAAAILEPVLAGS